VSKPNRTQEVTVSGTDDSTSPNKPAGMPVDDKSSTKKVTCSDKHNDKRSDKPRAEETDLAAVIEAWPDLPGHIKAAIKALITAHKGEET